MARTSIKFMELHSGMFLAGKGFPPKLDPERFSGLRMEYDPELKFIYVYWNQEVATLPLTSVLYFIEGEPRKREDTRAVEDVKPITKRVTAQVSGPVHHVHQGPGAGKTGKD